MNHLIGETTNEAKKKKTEQCNQRSIISKADFINNNARLSIIRFYFFYPRSEWCVRAQLIHTKIYRDLTSS